MKTIAGKVIIFMLAVVIATLSSACGQSEATAVAEASEVAVNAEQTPEEPASDDIRDGASFGVETGIIVYTDGSSLMICTPDGRNLNFLVADDNIDTGETRGLAMGSEVDVHYIGTVSGSNVSAAQVTKLAQSDEQAVVGTDASVTVGVILESNGESLTIATFDGEERTFVIAGETDLSKTKGLAADDIVTVFYEGTSLDGTKAVKAVRLVQ